MENETGGKTLYEQQIDAAVALRQSVRHDRERQEHAAQDLAMHKQAFRVAFDMLNEYWPPETNAEWFAPVYERFKEVYHQCEGNKLAQELLLAVYGYMDWSAAKWIKESGDSE